MRKVLLALALATGVCSIASGPALAAGTGTSAPAGDPPGVSTAWATNTTCTSAVLWMQVNPNGLDTTAHMHVSPLGILSKNVGSGTEWVEVGFPLTGLQPNASYFYFASATNSAGSTPSPPVGPVVVPLVLPPCRPPEAVTGSTTDVGLGHATLNGTVTPMDLATSARLEYGSSTSYGSTTTPVTVGAGEAPVPFSGMAVSLLCGKTYHYRAVAQSAAGSWRGGDATFQTKTCPAPAADFTGDAKGDLLWRHASRGELWEWTMNGAAPTATAYVGAVGTTWEIRGVGDYDGDRRADIFWRNATTGELFLWRMDGSTVVDRTYLGAVDTAYDIVGSGDVDGNGTADVLWRHATTGELWIWQMSGTTIGQVTLVARVPTEYAVAGVGDFDLDGKADILWWHATNGETWLWLMDGTASTSRSFLGWADPSYHVAGVADLSGNGMADIVWHHASAGHVWLWKMNGAAITSQFLVGTMFDPTYEIVALGDYNGDRPVDILWRHPDTGNLWMWLMGGSGLLSETVKVGQVEDTGYRVVTPR